MLKRPIVPSGFQGRVWGEIHRIHDFLLVGRWSSNRVSRSLYHQPSVSEQPEVPACGHHPPPR